MTEQVRARLETLREETDAETFAEVIRRALAVYARVWEAMKRDEAVVFRDRKGDERVFELL